MAEDWNPGNQREWFKGYLWPTRELARAAKQLRAKLRRELVRGPIEGRIGDARRMLDRHERGAVPWAIDRLLIRREGISEDERVRIHDALSAELRELTRKAREVGLARLLAVLGRERIFLDPTAVGGLGFGTLEEFATAIRDPEFAMPYEFRRFPPGVDLEALLVRQMRPTPSRGRPVRSEPWIDYIPMAVATLEAGGVPADPRKVRERLKKAIEREPAPNLRAVGRVWSDLEWCFRTIDQRGGIEAARHGVEACNRSTSEPDDHPVDGWRFFSTDLPEDERLADFLTGALGFSGVPVRVAKAAGRIYVGRALRLEAIRGKAGARYQPKASR